MVMMSQIVGAGVLARFAVGFPAREGRRRLPRGPPRLGSRRRRCCFCGPEVSGFVPLRDRDRVDTQRTRATLSSIIASHSRRRRRRGGSIRGDVIITQPLTPRSSQVAFDESARGRIDVAVLRAGEERLEAFAQLLPLVRVVAELGVGQKWVQHAQVGMLELFSHQPPANQCCQQHSKVRFLHSLIARANQSQKGLTPSESSPRLYSSRINTSTRTQRSLV